MTAFVVSISIVLVAGTLILVSNKSSHTNDANADNVSVTDGKQTIAISAKGGYSPRVTTAKAGLPTVIKMDTKGTFDCSSAVVIPSLSYRKNLPPSGETLIDLPPQQVGTKLQGLCAMGMYNFVVNFN